MLIDWDPATTADEIAQNVRCILATGPGTVPLARALGVPQDIIDSPQSAVAARLRADVTEAVETYETRAKVTAVRIASDGDGKLTATVELEGNADG